MSQLPFAQNAVPNIGQVTSIEPPWRKASPHDPPLMMFQVRFKDGRMISYSYSDLREIRRFDAGHLVIGIYGFEKYEITVKGRNLDEFYTLLAIGKIQYVEELGPHNFDRPENIPSIDSIHVENVTAIMLPEMPFDDETA